MKNEKKGFTLIELLAVLIVMGIILVIALQTYNHIIGNSNSMKYDYQWKLTKGASDIYADGIQENMTDGDCLLIDYDSLIFSNLLKEDKEDINCDGYVSLIKDGNKMVYNDQLLECSIKDNKFKKIEIDGNEISVGDISKNKNIINLKYGNNKSVSVKQCLSSFDANVSVGKISTNSVIVNSYCNDFNSEISEIRYLVKNNVTDNGYEGSGTNTTFKKSGLVDGTDYIVRVKCKNIQGKEKVSPDVEFKTMELKAPTIKADGNKAIKDNYYDKYTYKITFDDSNVESPVHYFKSAIQRDGLITEVDADNLYECNDALECNSIATSIKPNTWYKTTSSSVKITYQYKGTDSSKISGNIEAKISDGNNIKNATEPIAFNGDSGIILDSRAPEIETRFIVNEDGTYKAIVNCTTGASGISKKSIKCDGVNHNGKIEECSDSGEKNILDKDGYSYSLLSADSAMNDIYMHTVYCESKSGLKKTTNPNLDMDLSTQIDVNPKMTTRTKKYSISYTNNDALSGLGKYFIAGLGGTVNHDVYLCDENGCSGNGTTTVEAGKWYKTSSDVELTISVKSVKKQSTYITSVIGNGYSKPIVSYTYDETSLGLDKLGRSQLSVTKQSGASYVSDTWTNQNVYFNLAYNCEGGIECGVGGFEVSSDKVNIGFIGASYNNNGQYTAVYKFEDSQPPMDIYFRAVSDDDEHSVKGEWTDKWTVKIDKTTTYITPLDLLSTDKNGVSLRIGGNDFPWTSPSGSEHYLSGIRGVYVTIPGTDYDMINIGTGDRNSPSEIKFNLTAGTNYDAIFTVVDNAGNINGIVADLNYTGRTEATTDSNKKDPYVMANCITYRECECGDCDEPKTCTVSEPVQTTCRQCKIGGGGGCVGDEEHCAGSSFECVEYEWVPCTEYKNVTVTDESECGCAHYEELECEICGCELYTSGGWDLSFKKNNGNNIINDKIYYNVYLLYLKTLGRVPDDSETLGLYNYSLANGNDSLSRCHNTQDMVIRSIEFDSKSKEDKIKGLYWAILGRQVDTEEYNYYNGKYGNLSVNGNNYREMVNELRNSDEGIGFCNSAY